VPEDVVVARVMNRAVIGDAGVVRADDTPEALKVRLNEYRQKTAPLLELFQQKEMLVTVPAVKSIPEVYADLRAALGLPEAPPPD